MKKLAIFLTLGASILVSQSAFADHRFYNRGFNSWGFDYGYGYNRPFGRSFNRWGPRFYDPYRFGGGNYFSVSYGNRFGPYGYGRWGRRHFGGGDLLGGIVIGSLLANSYRDYNEPRRVERVVYSRPVSTTRKVAYVNRSQPAATSGRKLLRDLDGNCFEIAYNSSGDEVRTQIDPSVCAY